MNDEYLLTEDSKKLLSALYKKIDSPENDYIEQVYRAALEQSAKALNAVQIAGFGNLNSQRRLQDELARHIIHEMDIAYCWQNKYSDANNEST